MNQKQDLNQKEKNDEKDAKLQSIRMRYNVLFEAVTTAKNAVDYSRGPLSDDAYHNESQSARIITLMAETSICDAYSMLSRATTALQTAENLEISELEKEKESKRDE